VLLFCPSLADTDSANGSGCIPPVAPCVLPKGIFATFPLTRLRGHQYLESKLPQVLSVVKQWLRQLDEGPMRNRPLEGYIGFQVHGEPNNFKFRNIRIREIVR
jgi:hypothetical protein